MSKKTNIWLVIIASVVAITILGGCAKEEQAVAEVVENKLMTTEEITKYAESLFSSICFENCVIKKDTLEINLFIETTELAQTYFNDGWKLEKIFSETPARIFYRSDDIDIVKINIRDVKTKKIYYAEINQVEYENFWEFTIDESREYYPDNGEITADEKWRNNIGWKLIKDETLVYFKKHVKTK